MEPTGVQRATTLVLVGLAAVGAASALANDHTGFGDVQALCLVQNPLSSTIESWPDPGFEPEPQRTFAFLQQRWVTGSSSAMFVSGARDPVVWTTVQGEHRAEPADALSVAVAQNIEMQLTLECSAP
jgi:hypothetical protein